MELQKDKQLTSPAGGSVPPPHPPPWDATAHHPPAPSPAPKRTPLPSSIQVRLQYILSHSFINKYFAGLDAASHFYFIRKTKKHNSHFFIFYLTGKVPRHAHPHLVEWNNVPRLPSPHQPNPPPIQKPALTPTGPPTLRKRDSKSKDLCPVQALSPQSSDSSKTKDKDGEFFSVWRKKTHNMNVVLIVLIVLHKYIDSALYL